MPGSRDVCPPATGYSRQPRAASWRAGESPCSRLWCENVHLDTGSLCPPPAIRIRDGRCCSRSRLPERPHAGLSQRSGMRRLLLCPRSREGQFHDGHEATTARSGPVGEDRRREDRPPPAGRQKAALPLMYASWRTVTILMLAPFSDIERTLPWPLTRLKSSPTGWPLALIPPKTCAECRPATAVETAESIASEDFAAIPLEAAPPPHEASTSDRTANKPAPWRTALARAVDRVVVGLSGRAES
jgi:hypothetical protein